MDINNIKAPTSTTTIDKKELEKGGKSVYEVINVIAKRSNIINNIIKNELDKKLIEFILPNDNLEEIFENREQIEISLSFERLPKATLIAIQEFLDGKIKYEYKKNEK